MCVKKKKLILYPIKEYYNIIFLNIYMHNRKLKEFATMSKTWLNLILIILIYKYL